MRSPNITHRPCAQAWYNHIWAARKYCVYTPSLQPPAYKLAIAILATARNHKFSRFLRAAYAQAFSIIQSVICWLYTLSPVPMNTTINKIHIYNIGGRA